MKSKRMSNRSAPTIKTKIMAIYLEHLDKVMIKMSKMVKHLAIFINRFRIIVIEIVIRISNGIVVQYNISRRLSTKPNMIRGPTFQIRFRGLNQYKMITTTKTKNSNLRTT